MLRFVSPLGRGLGLSAAMLRHSRRIISPMRFFGSTLGPETRSIDVVSGDNGEGRNEPARARLFRLLHLNTFSEKEIKEAHALLQNAHQECLQASTQDNVANGPTSQSRELLRLAKELKLMVEAPIATTLSDGSSDKLPQSSKSLKVPVDADLAAPLLQLPEFTARLRQSGEELDVRVWPIALSFATTGLSIGIIIPILPVLVKEINISSAVFGVAVSAFGLAKLIGNVPSAAWVEKYGRKPVLVGGMVVCAASLGSIGFSLIPELGAPWLIGCRFVTGLGVAAFTSGAFMYMSDISTALNRARTMAPVMSSFTAGTAVGPAIGGLAVEHLGIMNSYLTVGSSIALLAALNQAFLHESRPPRSSPAPVAPSVPSPNGGPHSVDQVQGKSANASGERGGSFAVAYREWKKLIKTKPLRDVVLLNGVYWVALAGTQLTLLPLFMVNGLSLGPDKIGIIFSSISVVSVLVAQPCAHMADKWGKVPTMLLGTGLLSLSFFLVPLTSSFEELVLAVVPLALGGPILSTVPTAHVSDLSTPEQRAQALALLRTAGDTGLLTGAVSAGVMSEMVGMGDTMQGNASMLAAAAILYGLRQRQYTPALTGQNADAPEKETK
jgi:MFS family permease